MLPLYVPSVTADVGGLLCLRHTKYKYMNLAGCGTLILLDQRCEAIECKRQRELVVA
jgi:hypothetical protein